MNSVSKDICQLWLNVSHLFSVLKGLFVDAATGNGRNKAVSLGDPRELQASEPPPSPAKVIEQIVLKSSNTEDRKATGRNQYGFTLGKSCRADLVTLCDEMTALVNEGRGGDVAQFDQNFQWCLLKESHRQTDGLQTEFMDSESD